MGAKHYQDHEIRYLIYSVLYNSRVRGENAALARQLKRSEGAVLQEKTKIREVIAGVRSDSRIERILSEFAPPRKRRRTVVKKGAVHSESQQGVNALLLLLVGLILIGLYFAIF